MSVTTEAPRLKGLEKIVYEWQLARDRYDLPEGDPETRQERERWLLLWERQLREWRL